MEIEDRHKDVKAEAQALLDALSERQTEVMELASRPGASSDKEIIRDLSGDPISKTAVQSHLAAAKRKLGVTTRQAAIAKFVVARTLVNRSTSIKGHLLLSEEVVEKVLRDLSSEDARELLSDPEFQELANAIRAKGLRGLKALLGRWGVTVAIVAGVIGVLVIVAFTLAIARLLDLAIG